MIRVTVTFDCPKGWPGLDACQVCKFHHSYNEFPTPVVLCKHDEMNIEAIIEHNEKL